MARPRSRSRLDSIAGRAGPGPTTLPPTSSKLARAGDSADVPGRVAQATDFLLRNVVTMQGAVRAMIASTITREDVIFPRPGKQFGLIDLAVAPLERPPGAMEPGKLTQFKLDLAVIMSAEALTDLAGLAPQDAIASIVRTARTITEAAMQSPVSAPSHVPT